MIQKNPNLFTGNPLDRAGVRRRDPDWVSAQRTHDNLRFLPFHKGQALFTEGASGHELDLQWLSRQALDSLPPSTEFILLGLDGDIPHWAADVTAETERFGDLGHHLDLREAGWRLDPAEAAIVGHAAWLLEWHRTHRFCARYGRETVLAEGGFKRINTVDETEHFPRTNPVAIMLPIHGDQICLGRSPQYPEQMYSTFAGFLEACETLEECAARELVEEIGLVATNIEYLFSQPWPFPASLMVGYHVDVETTALTIDPQEISDARWMDREELILAMNGQHPDGIFTPPPFAIAHQLLKVWLAR